MASLQCYNHHTHYSYVETKHFRTVYVVCVVQGLSNMSLPDVMAQWVAANQADIKLPQVGGLRQQEVVVSWQYTAYCSMLDVSDFELGAVHTQLQPVGNTAAAAAAGAG
jgi:hypothetical protein